jgi:hypothetical protein
MKPMIFKFYSIIFPRIWQIHVQFSPGASRKSGIYARIVAIVLDFVASTKWFTKNTPKIGI